MTGAGDKLLREGEGLPPTFFFVLREGKTERVSSASLFGTGRSVLFGMPGAFTPTCSKHHLPEVLRQRTAFARHGVGCVACFTTQDPFVMQAWRQSYASLAEEGEEEKEGEEGEEKEEKELPPLLMLSDASLEATRAFGMEADLSDMGLGTRSLRFAVILEEGIVRWLSAPEARGECRLSDAGSVLEALEELD